MAVPKEHERRAMTIIQRLDEALRAKGWSYDAENEVFRDRAKRRMRYSRVLALVPGIAADDLASYQNYQWAKQAVAEGDRSHTAQDNKTMKHDPDRLKSLQLSELLKHLAYWHRQIGVRENAVRQVRELQEEIATRGH